MPPNDTNEKLAGLTALVEAAATSAAASAQSALEAKQAHESLKNFTDELLKINTALEKKAEDKKKGKHIKDYLEDYQYFTGKASDINRSLSIAGLAIIWLLLKDTDIITKVGSSVQLSSVIPKNLLLPFFLLLISLSLDLLHYISGSILWGTFHWKKDKQWERDELTDAQAANVEAPAWRRNIINFFFISKFLPTITAYVLLVLFLKNKIHFS